MYPNPAKNLLNIAVEDSVEMKSISIYNMPGQLVLAIPSAQQIESIDVSDLKPGHYFIKINSDKGFSTSRFAKE